MPSNATAGPTIGSSNSQLPSSNERQSVCTGLDDDLVYALDSFCAWSTCTLSDRGQHERRTDFEKLPPILTVHLPRVRWDNARQRAIVDATPLTFSDTICLDPYVRINEQDKDPSALGGIRVRRECIAKDLKHLDMDSKVQTVLRFVELAGTRHKGDRNLLDTLPASLHGDLQRLKSLIEARRRALMEEDARLLKLMRQMLEQNGKYKYRLHAIILHRGNDDRPSAGHYYVHVRNLDHKDKWVTFDDARVTRVKDIEGMMHEAYGFKREDRVEAKDRTLPADGNSVVREVGTKPHHCCARTLVYVRVLPASVTRAGQLATATDEAGRDNISLDPFLQVDQFPRLASPDDLRPHLQSSLISPPCDGQPYATPLDEVACMALAATLPDSGGRAKLEAQLRVVEGELQREIEAAAKSGSPIGPVSSQSVIAI